MELSLLAIAITFNALLGLPWLANLHWNELDMITGLAGVGPLLLLFLATQRFSFKWLADIKHILRTIFLPFFRGWSVWQLAVISALAGVCEEALFRGMMQPALEVWLGPAGALVLTSVLFGALHPLSWTYALVTAIIGVYLGMTWLLTGNLLTPIIIHAVYDFIALVWLLRTKRL